MESLNMFTEYGFFGLGAGSFFVMGFVVVLGFQFIEASTYSKVINCKT